MTLGMRLRTLRARRNWTLEDVAEKIGITRSMLSMVECEHALPSLLTLQDLADAFSMQISELLRDVRIYEVQR